MKAGTWNELGARPALRDDLPEPAPGAGEVRVRVHATSVNPVDKGIVAGMVNYMVPHESPVTLGRGASHTQGKLALRVAVPETPQ